MRGIGGRTMCFMAKCLSANRPAIGRARLLPDRPALIRGEQCWTWTELEQRVAAVATALRRFGLRKRDRILVQSRNNVQMFESCWIAFRLGSV